MADERISGDAPYASHFVEVYGSKMHYVDEGTGNPILFLHGIPTSSYLWRNIIPHLSTLGRCIAPDLIGLGQSAKPDIAYSLADHINYIEKFIAALGLTNITLVMHGWGSVIGFHYAMQHEKNCHGLVFYEAFLRSLDGNNVSLPFQEQLMFLQEQISEGSASNGVDFVDKIIMQNIMHPLSKVEIDNYCNPFREKGSSRPILQYLQEVSTGKGEDNRKIEQLIANYSKKLVTSKLPKLMLYSVPGFITTIATVMWAKENLPNLEIVDVGEELHFAQESNPALIGEAISVWMQGIEAMHA